jgi:large subunit ribosomal protein L37Ae
MGNTKKVKSTGRFGSRYGVGIRKRLIKIESEQNKLQQCPKCGFKKVKRKSKGIFECGKCKAVFAGGAYLPSTTSGRVIEKMVAQKSFMPKMTELISAKEEPEKEAVEGKANKRGENKKKSEKEVKERSKEKSKERNEQDDDAIKREEKEE